MGGKGVHPGVGKRRVFCSSRFFLSENHGAIGTCQDVIEEPPYRLLNWFSWRAAVVQHPSGSPLQSATPILKGEVSMRFERVSFGSIRIDGTTYEHDVVIDRGRVRRRKKKPSKQFRGEFGHTPLSIEEKIPWKCRRLVVGTGTGALPVMEEVKREARRRKIKLMILSTKEAIKELKQRPDGTNAVLHVTC